MGQVGQGEGVLQILVGQVEQGEGGLEIFVGQVGQGQGVCPREPFHLSQMGLQGRAIFLHIYRPYDVQVTVRMMYVNILVSRIYFGWTAHADTRARC